MARAHLDNEMPPRSLALDALEREGDRDNGGSRRDNGGGARMRCMLPHELPKKVQVMAAEAFLKGSSISAKAHTIEASSAASRSTLPRPHLGDVAHQDANVPMTGAGNGAHAVAEEAEKGQPADAAAAAAATTSETSCVPGAPANSLAAFMAANAAAGPAASL